MSLQVGSLGVFVLSVVMPLVAAPSTALAQSGLPETTVAFGPVVDGSFTGTLSGLDISFAARPLDQLGAYELAIDLPDARRVESVIDYVNDFGSVRLISLVSGELVPIAATDVDALRHLGRMILRSGGDSDQSDSAYVFFRLLSWITDAPPGMLLDIKTTFAASPDVLSRCSKVGKKIQAVWDAGTIFTEIKTKKVKVGPCLAGDCLGRCGAGCDGAFGWEKAIQQFTQDCLNHDVCCDEEGGCSALVCQDEFNDTFDDALVATDCNALEGLWDLTFKTNKWNSSPRSYGMNMTFKGDFVGTTTYGAQTATISGTRGAPLMKGASIKLPLFLPSCSGIFGGYARANLQGASRCGQFDVRLKNGTWLTYDTGTCEIIGAPSWTGRLTGVRTDKVSRTAVEEVLARANASAGRRQ